MNKLDKSRCSPTRTWLEASLVNRTASTEITDLYVVGCLVPPGSICLQQEKGEASEKGDREATREARAEPSKL